MPDAELKYGFEKNGNRHIWYVKGPLGAVHVWATMQDDHSFQQWGDRWLGGIECHSPKPLYEHQPEPSHTDCWLLGGSCYHDGSSLQFSEQVAPYLPDSEAKLNPEEPLIQSILHDRYENWLKARESL